MKTIISDKIYIYNPTNEVMSWVKNNLYVVNPEYQTLKRIGKEDVIARGRIPEKIALFIQTGSKDLAIPSGCLRGVWDLIKNDNYELKFSEIHSISPNRLKSGDIELKLYDYQQKAVDFMLSKKGGVLEAPCGSGKTEMACAMTKMLGQRTLFLCHTGDLLNQAKDRFKKYLPYLKVGTITEGKVQLGEDVTFSTWQTMCKIDRDIYKDYFNVIIVDECHHCASSPTQIKHLGQIVDSCKARYKFGVTATPSRSDTMINSMYAILGLNTSGDFKAMYEIQKSETPTLTSQHIKVDLDTPFSYLTLKSDGTMDYAYLIDYLSDNEERNEQIVGNVLKCVQNGRKQLVLCNLVKQCDWFQERFEELGIKSQELTGSVTSKNRNKVLHNEIEWDVIVATYSLAKEGLDLPMLDTLHLATPQKMESIVVQSAGRIERVREGKNEPIIYDYVDVNFPYCLGAYKKRKSHLKNR